jgi:TPR repeat protein
MIHQTISATLLLSALGAMTAQAEPPVTEREEAVPKEQESPEQIYRAAADLLKGNGGDADARKGFELMLKAANQNHLPAFFGIAYLYHVGMGTAKDLSKAIEWFGKAAERDHAISQFNLGKLLIAETTPLQPGMPDLAAQHNEGLEWLRKAAVQGLNEAKTAYGTLLMNGDMGLKQDPATAARIYLIPAADAGDTEAMNALGTLYQIGNGVPYDPAAAEVFFRKAAMAGNVKAQANLGEHLDPSSKKESLRIEAFAWLFLAEEAKNVYAKKILKSKLPATSPDDVAAAKLKAAEIRRQIRELIKESPRKEP